MPVFNAGDYLKTAVDSILTQYFSDFEFLIIDDGSTDGSIRQLLAYRDSRIEIVTNPTNIGLVDSLNLGLSLARGEYIARMDGDDLSLPERLAAQVAYMDARPEVGICGSWIRVMGSNPSETWRYPDEHDAIVCRHLFSSTLAHPSVMMRRSVLLNEKLLYDSNKANAEDYAFWCECSRHTRLGNVPKILLEYRIPANRPNLAEYERKQQEMANTVRREELARLGIDATADELLLHQSIALGRHRPTLEYLRASLDWFDRILKADKHKQLFNHDALKRELGYRWLDICQQAKPVGWLAWKNYRNSTLSECLPMDRPNHWLFLMSCLNTYIKTRLRGA